MTSKNKNPTLFLTKWEVDHYKTKMKKCAADILQEKDVAFADMVRICLSMRGRRVENYLWSMFGGVVQAGPFRGMTLVDAAIGSQVSPRLIGSYEHELTPVIETAGRYQRVVNVGCAEGWYAVGLARRFPTLEVIAYDTNASARALCAKAASLNGVADRVAVRGTFDVAEARRTVLPGTLVIMDIEGAERALMRAMDPAVIAKADWVIETHVMDDRGTLDDILEIAPSTHDVDVIAQDPRAVEVPPDVAGLRQLDRFLASWEGRGADPWVILRRRDAT